MLEDDRVVESSGSHVEAPISDTTDAVSGSVQKLRDAFMDLGTEPEQTGASSSSQERNVKDPLENDGTFASTLANADADDQTSLEVATEVEAPISDEAEDGPERMVEEQTEVVAEDVLGAAVVEKEGQKGQKIKESGPR